MYTYIIYIYIYIHRERERPYPQYGRDFPAEIPEMFWKDPGNALRALSGIKMTGLPKTSLLIFVVFARFIALTAKFWQVCAQQRHKETDNILNTTTKCGCYVTGACVARSVRNKTDTREIFDHLWILERSFEHEF